MFLSSFRPIRRTRLKSRFGRRVGPERDARYLAYIRSLPCLICGSWNAEAAHTGPHAYTVKASDYTAIPLCAMCHREGPESNHKLGRKWAEHHGIDLEMVRSRYLIEFEEKAA